MVKPKDLIDFDMKTPRQGASTFPLEKILMEDEEGNTIAMCIYKTVGVKPHLVLRLPSGEMLSLGGAETLEDLETIERCITGYFSCE